MGIDASASHYLGDAEAERATPASDSSAVSPADEGGTSLWFTITNLLLPNSRRYDPNPDGIVPSSAMSAQAAAIHQHRRAAVCAKRDSRAYVDSRWPRPYGGVDMIALQVNARRQTGA